MNQKEYLYIIVRADLSPAQRAVQSVHASIEAIKNKTLHSHPSVIILAVKNELKLKEFVKKLEIDVQIFREPDLGGEITAVAAGPFIGKCRNPFRRLQLMK